MKKIISLLAISVICVLLALGAFAADVTYTLGSATVNAGDSVELPITVSATVAYKEMALSHFAYDTSVFEFAGFTNRDAKVAEMAGQFFLTDDSKMAIAVGFMNADANAYCGSICSIKFKVKSTAKSGTYEIVPEYVLTRNGGSNVFESSAIPATVTVIGSSNVKDDEPEQKDEQKPEQKPVEDNSKPVKNDDKNDDKNEDDTIVVKDEQKDDKTETDNEENTQDKPEDKKEDNIPAVTEWQNPFTDISKHWAFEYIKDVSTKGLMNGMTSTTFAPEQQLTRAMLVTILYRLDGKQAVSGTVDFKDVKLSDYYGDALIWAVQNGIVNGVTATEFAPNSPIQRQQIATIFYRYAQKKGYDVTLGGEATLAKYSSNKIEKYALDGINFVVTKGIMNGLTDSNFGAYDGTTRAQVATIISRFMEAFSK